MAALKLLVLAAASTGAAIIFFTMFFSLLWREAPPSKDARAVIVLSGPGAVPGLRGETLSRTNRGIEIWRKMADARLVVTGGLSHSHGAPHAQFMAEYARAAGVPPEAILEEPDAGSTLQNALFSSRLDGIDPSARVIVVTHRYHLPRAWASFRWAGFRNIQLAAADTPGLRVNRFVLFEAVKWPLNIVRAGASGLAAFAGIPDDRVEPWLK